MRTPGCGVEVGAVLKHEKHDSGRFLMASLSEPGELSVRARPFAVLIQAERGFITRSAGLRWRCCMALAREQKQPKGTAQEDVFEGFSRRMFEAGGVHGVFLR